MFLRITVIFFLLSFSAHTFEKVHFFNSTVPLVALLLVFPQNGSARRPWGLMRVRVVHDSKTSFWTKYISSQRLASKVFVRVLKSTIFISCGKS